LRHRFKYGVSKESRLRK